MDFVSGLFFGVSFEEVDRIAMSEQANAIQVETN